MSRLFILPLLTLAVSCYWNNDRKIPLLQPVNRSDSLAVVRDIEPPPGFKRINVSKTSFGEWLRSISIKKDRHVYLYNGSLKRNQQAQFVVLNISVGNKDLQQCADAIMRLRAEYLFSQKRYTDIEFRDNANKAYKWTGGADRYGFDRYLERVFGMCGSASLEKQLKPVSSFHEIQPGDILIKGGFPGHAMIVMDIAVNETGRKMYMLAQSYMPAQDIHIVKNPADNGISPWYEVNEDPEIDTPQWTFFKNQLRRW